VKLGNVINFCAGQNSTRIKAKQIPEVMLYTSEDAELDLVGEAPGQQRKGQQSPKQKGVDQQNVPINAANKMPPVTEDVTTAGDLIVHLIRGKASVAGSAGAGKIISASFVKCEMDTDQYDPWFMCYVLNESQTARRKMELDAQSSFTAASRLSIATMKEIDVEFPPIEIQRQIGEIYRETLKYEHLMNEKINLTKQMVINNLHEIGGV